MEEERADEIPKTRRGRLPGETRLKTAFLSHLIAQGYAQSTVKEYRIDLKFINEFSRLILKKHPLKLSLSEIEQYVMWLAQERGNKGAIIRRRLASFASFCKWCARQDLPVPSVNALQRPKLGRSLPKHIGDEGFEDLKKELKDNAHQDLVACWGAAMLMAGLRVSEIQTIQVVDNLLQVKGKGNKERLIPVPLWVKEAVQNHLSSNARAFKADRRVIWKAVRQRWNLHPHQLRHSFGTQLIRRGLSINEIQLLMGHADIRATMIYVDTKRSDKCVALLDG